MNLDTIEALEVLRRYGIRVARSKLVDSPEDAIAFAERRTAKDPRLMPVVFPPDQTPLRTEEAIRRAYARLAFGGGRILAQTMIGPGTDVMIHRRTDDSRAQITALEPLGDHHLYSGEKAHHMLEHLLLRVSSAFEGSGATELRLMVRLHENGYTVLDAAMTVPRELHFKKRLDGNAHDRRADEARSARRANEEHFRLR